MWWNSQTILIVFRLGVNTLLMLINSMVLSFLVYAMIDYCIKTRKPSVLFKKSASNLDVWNKIRQN